MFRRVLNMSERGFWQRGGGGRGSGGGGGRGGRGRGRGGRGYHRDGEERREYSQFNRDQGDDKRQYKREYNEGPSGQDQGGSGQPQRGRGGRGPPAGLRGRDIGMYYAKKSQEKKMKQRIVAHIPHKQLDMFEVELEKILREQDRQEDKSDHLIQLRKNIAGNARMDERFSLAEKTANSSKSDIQQNDLNAKDYIFREYCSTKLESDEVRSRGAEGQPKETKLLGFRNKLPAATKREEILDLINRNQVVVITGETGCGKTTQVPQFILEEHEREMKTNKCRIVVTQPRRISAISVAERIADERDQRLGESVGYQIRLESKLPTRNNSILLCTTGIVLRWLRSLPDLSTITHLILDEIHERDVQSDFLMTICKSILQVRPDFKLILMSATMNSQKFSRYFANCPSLNIPGFTFPVEQFFLEDILEMTAYKSQIKDSRGYRNKGFQRGRKDRDREFEDQSYEEELGPFLRHLESSGNYSQSTVDFLRNSKSEELDMELAAATIKYIHQNKGEGAVLVFVPGLVNISTLNRLLEPGGQYHLRSTVIYPLHSLMPTINQRAIFARPPAGMRKVIIATNIAETSITIEDVVYVVDCGKIKISQFDEKLNLSTILPEWISLANMKQRRGRAGRTSPGQCYHLFTSYRHNLLDAYLPPEMCRTRIEQVILQIKLLQLGSCKRFLEKVLDPPSLVTIDLSLDLLVTMNAVRLKGDTEELTPLGFHLARLPLDPQTGKMILMASIFSCVDPILSVAASLSFKDAFMVPLGKEKEVDAKKLEFGENTYSDHLMLANVITEYLESNNKSAFCWNNFLSQSSMKMLISLKSDLCRNLRENGFLQSQDPLDAQANLNSDNEALVRAVICSGLYPNTAKIKSVKKNVYHNTTLMSINERRILFHPKSILSSVRVFPYPWVVYHLKQKSTNTYLFDATVVSPLALLFFGQYVKSGLDKLEDGSRIETVHADNFVAFNCDERTANVVASARRQLDLVIQAKLSDPRPTSWTSSTGNMLELIIKLLHTELEGLEDGYEDQ